MRFSNLFTKTEKRDPRDEESKSAKLLQRAGFIKKEISGVYSFLPLGFKVMEKIEKIISEEMERIGAQRILMPALTPKKNWEITGRWKNFDTLFKIEGRNHQEYALSPTHEEIIVPLVKRFISSYKDLPFSAFQIQTKFRDEKRVKSGLLRTKEFIMKDLYSFHQNEEDLNNFYEKVERVYFRIFKRVGLKKDIFLTLARGGTFSKYSHEFQLENEYGEDTIYPCKKCQVAINQELIRSEKDKRCWKCGEKIKEKVRAIEIGNIFKLGDKFSKDFNLFYKDRKGERKYVIMGCYGIGITRLMGSIVEKNNDKKGIIWPKSIAPFEIHLVSLEKEKKVVRYAERIYKILQEEGREVLYDDRKDKSPGEKLVDADLIGIPLRVVISKRNLLQHKIEIKERKKTKTILLKERELINFLKSK